MWISLSLLVRLLWAGTNAVDQVLSRMHSEQRTVAALVVQYLCLWPFAIIAYFLSGPFQIHSHFIYYCLGAVLACALAMLPYLSALQREQAYDVTPYLELTPVFLIAFAYLFKGEALTPVQLTGAGIVILSGFLFSWDFARAHFKATLFMMLAIASALFAFYQYCVSQAANYSGIWGVIACYYMALSFIGMVLFLASKNVRNTIRKTFVETKGLPFALGLSTNALDILAFSTLLLAFRSAPTLGHVAALSGIQPIFSFVLALPLAKFFPAHFSKVVFDHTAIVKLTLIGFIFIGVYLLAIRSP